MFYPNSMVRYCQGCTLLARTVRILFHFADIAQILTKINKRFGPKNKYTTQEATYHGYYFYDPA